MNTIQNKFTGLLPVGLVASSTWLKLGFVLSLTLLAMMAQALPANDGFTNAVSISGLSGSLSSTNNGATLEAGEPDFINTDDFASVDKSVWYKWTAPSNGVVAFDTFGSSFDTVLAVYTPNFSSLTNLVAANDDYISFFVVQSRVTFTAVAGKTYYVSVNGNAYPTSGSTDAGSFVLNWTETVPTILSGNFFFTSSSYTVSDNESSQSLGISDTPMENVPQIWNARVTVTRTNGSSGRVLVPYTVVKGASQGGATNSGTLIFDDYQMSADILVPVVKIPTTNSISGGTNPVPVTYAPPASIFVTLGTPTLDALESSDLIPPVAAGVTNTTITVLSRFYGSSPSDSAALGTPFFNIERVNYRCRESQGNATIWVYPSQAPGSGHTFTIQYAIDHNTSLTDLGSQTHTFQLQAGSDYATPGEDFTDVTGGTLSWSDNDSLPKVISIPINDDSISEFNEDMQVTIYNPRLDNNSILALGQVNKATLTILDNDQPAGAVDKTWNKDGANDSVPPFLRYPGTQGGVSDSANGNGGTVYAVAEQSDGKAIVAGSFVSFDSNPYNRIVRLLSNGYQDTSFLASPNSGANDTINAAAIQPDGKIVVAGNFTSFNGASRYHVARLNTNGTVDATFNPGTGANGRVLALGIQSDGKIFVGGEFTAFNGTNCNYLARLTTNGALDTAFSPSNSLNGPVYAIAVPPFAPININRDASGGFLEDDYSVNLGLSTSGTLTVDYDFLMVPDDMKVFYGGTNDILIYDTGLTNGTGHLVIPFGTTNGLTTNVITIVMDQGNGDPGTVWSYTASVTTPGSTQVYAGGAFTQVGPNSYGSVARFNGDGSVDPTFAPGIGTYNPDTRNTDPVFALALQSDGKLLAGGSFSYVEMLGINGVARFNLDGTVDTAFSTIGTNNGTFNPVTKGADTVNAITLQSDGKILIGGDFTTINQTRRVGIARLFSDGSVDTSFMDTAYNQFAGLINHYHNSDAVNTNDYPQGNHRNSVKAIALESGGNVIVGGNFLRVGGGSYGHADSISLDGIYGVDRAAAHGIYYNGRLDIHPRSNVARLIGGVTPGPGNMELSYNSYSVDKDAGTLFVSLVRTNGNLGTIAANFYSPTGATNQQGIATVGTDFTIGNLVPTWDTMWSSSAWMKSTAFDGQNYNIGVPGNSAPETLTIYNNTNISGNLDANLALIAPNSTLFSLGGEVIPLGAALGAIQTSPLTIIDDNFPPGTFSFSAPAYTVNESSNAATITIVRTNGTKGSVTVYYSTFNGTATSPTNYTAVSDSQTFNDGETIKTFTVPIVPSTLNQQDKTVNLLLYGITGGGKAGLTNAVLTIVNNVYGAGHIAFAFATNAVNENAGTASVVLNRLGASSGTMDVTAITSDGSALNGVNYVGLTNVVHWDSGDALPKTVTIPVKHDSIFTSNLTVNIRLTNGLVNNNPSQYVLGLSTVTNSTLVISNIDFPGTVEFSTAVYSVKKSAGFALIPVVRAGGSAGTITVTNYTSNSSALNGVNYTGLTNVLTFTNGQVSQFFNVPIAPGATSGLVSLNLALTNAVALGTPTAWNALGTPNKAVLNIIDTFSVNETPGAPDATYSPLSGFNGPVYALSLQTNNQLIVGGSFTMANGIPRQRIARLNPDGTLDGSFSLPSSSMGADGSVRAIAIQSDGRIVVGGGFTNFNNVVVNHIARLNYDGSLDSRFNPGSGADSQIYAVAETFVNGQRKILVAGGFALLNGVTVNGIGRLNDDGSPDMTFNSGGLGANGIVYALAVQSDGKILIGGDFTALNGITVSHIARLNVDGSVDLTFTNATANDSVRAITLQLDGQILAGGLFTSVNGNTNFNHIARLNSADGSADNTFKPGLGANDAVLSIALQTDGRIMLGGTFTRCSGVTRNRITRLNPDGTVDPTINFGSGADSFVAAIVVQESTIASYPAGVPDEKIVIAGGFTHYYGETHQYLARIYGGSMSGSGAFQFSSANYLVNENGTNAVITLIRTGGTSGTNSDGSGNVYVNFVTSDGTANADVDHAGVTNYFNVVTNVAFPAGEVQQNVIIAVRDDMLITSNLTVNLTLTPVSPAAVGDQPTAVLSIVNVDSAINFSAATYLASKYGASTPNGFAPININRIGATYGTSTVVFNTGANGTAVAGTDYQPETNVVITFFPGESVHTVFIPVINGVSDGDRTVSLQLTNVANSVLYAPSNAVLTILDRTEATGSFVFSSPNYVVSEGGGSGNVNATITVVRTNGTTGIVTVDYGTMNGTAIAGAKYVTTSGTLTFGDGEWVKTFNVPVVNTGSVEPTENFYVLLSNPTGGAALGSLTNASVTILNTNIGIAFTVATNTFSETTSFATINVQRYNNTQGTTTVNYSTTNGTAVAGVNYAASSGTLTFNDGASQAAILIPLTYDSDATGDLQFTVGLSSPSAGVQIGTPSMTTVIIKDVDAGLSFTNATARVLKNAGSLVVTVVCSNTNVEPVSVDYTTTDGTATNHATAGTDYTAVSGTLVFSNGVSVQTFTVPIINNGAVAGDHTFTITLSNPTGNGRLGSPSVQTVTIVDSNSGLNFSSANYTVAKTGGAALITVYRTGYTDSIVSVNFMATNGTAINGLNFMATNGTLVFPNGVTARTFSVPVIATTTVQPDLTVLLALSSASNSIVLAPSAATLSIHDNTGSYVIPAGSQLVSESGAGIANGIIDPNETVTVLFAFRDAGGTNVGNLVATLLATNGVTPINPVTATYGSLTYKGHSASQPFTFTAHGTNAQQIAATFKLQDGATTIGTAIFGYTLGNSTSVFSNSAAIIINDNTNASPYPSVINVSGIGGSVVKATVTLNKLTHTSPFDVDALVVSPAQLNTLILAHAGGGNAVTNIVLTFDDAATNTLSHFGQITTSTNKPTQYFPVRNFP